ncbi:MAG TPA: glycosyltransferase family 39 protein [Chthoniobacteraceae bacterium]
MAIQDFVHKLEEGGWAKWIRLFLLIVTVAYVVNLWMFRDSGFKGLSDEKAIEQAQISREIARGNGFSTQVIRPAALSQFEAHKGRFPLEKTPDTYHAPLHPAINSLALRLTRDSWKMTQKDVVYTSDKAIAGVALVFFFLAVAVNFFTARRLFDGKLAIMVVCFLLVCQTLWDFSLTGLPQMLMLFLFSVAAYCLVRAIEAHTLGERTFLWNGAAAVAFGLLALAHALTIFLFAGALLFMVIFLRPRGRDAAIMLAIFALIYTPWMVRNYQVCGNPLGLGWYSGLAGVIGSESAVMRSMSFVEQVKEAGPEIFGEKLRGQVIRQFGEIYQLLGALVLAPVFFVALLHLFKRPETSLFRWCLLSMWLFGIVGIAVVGLGSRVYTGSDALDPNNLHILFAPLMVSYGLAFVLVLWSRLELNVKLIRFAFIGVLYFVSAMPFLSQVIELHQQPKGRVQWPPYVAPFIAILGEWTIEREIIASDMPWAVAWYADRKSLWLPMTLNDFISLNDYNRLGGQIIGMYLTPITGHRGFINEVVKGEYKEWAPFIMRQVNIKDFPLRAVTALPVENECVFYADRDRWSNRED